jgi:DNA-binding response OmpR family regulator
VIATIHTLSSPARRAARLQSEAMRIVLVVEDDAPLRAMYRTALRMAGFFVQEAGNGFDALRALDADPPDLVVLDLGLPGLSGYAVRQEIAMSAHTHHVPVVVVTGLPGPHEDLRVDRVLHKPVTPEELVEVVRQCLASIDGAAH